jgi:hypothetical protein
MKPKLVQHFSSVRRVVEVDGCVPRGSRSADRRRDEKLQRLGYRVLLVESRLVMRSVEAAVACCERRWNSCVCDSVSSREAGRETVAEISSHLRLGRARKKGFGTTGRRARARRLSATLSQCRPNRYLTMQPGVKRHVELALTARRTHRAHIDQIVTRANAERRRPTSRSSESAKSLLAPRRTARTQAE